MNPLIDLRNPGANAPWRDDIEWRAEESDNAPDDFDGGRFEALAEHLIHAEQVWMWGELGPWRWVCTCGERDRAEHATEVDALDAGLSHGSLDEWAVYS